MQHDPKKHTLEASTEAFLRSLIGRKLSPQTTRAYRTDVTQFVAWLAETNGVADTASKITRLDMTEYLAHLWLIMLICQEKARRDHLDLPGGVITMICHPSSP